jgi:putative protease
MGLLEMDLPPIALHASTQTDNRTPEKVRFLEQVGFSQVVLARELSLAEIRAIADASQVALEFFIHGALCVSYSGQCYISHAHTGRSANRGECSQLCRLPYSLADSDGHLLAENRHLLSLKDNNQSDNLEALLAAGVRSFKIEGRLKDLAYVKNITAHYRQRLDAIIDTSADYRRASAGRCAHRFVPQPEKTFNRGSTDYFVHGRQADIVSLASPKFAGEALGEVVAVGNGHFDVAATQALKNGDGLSFIDASGELAGLRASRVEQRGRHWRIFPGDGAPRVATGTTLCRNLDRAFEHQLEGKSAERKIGVRLHLGETTDGFALTLVDEEGVSATATLPHAKEAAQHGERARQTLREQLGKLGNTRYAVETLSLDLAGDWFLPTSAINALRRTAIDTLDAARLAAWRRPPHAAIAEPPARYPASELSYLGNVFNNRARSFYEKHGVALIEPAYEANQEKGLVSLMITKHCLRYSFNLCPKQVKGIRPDPMTLINGDEKLALRFDCKRCEMHVVGKLKDGR